MRISDWSSDVCSSDLFLEGALIAAWAVGCECCYIYLRDEYPAVREILLQEIAKLEAAGLTKHCPLELRRGAGAYICGEESAMLESRSEEHTSELQSLMRSSYAVFCSKQKKKKHYKKNSST